MQVSTHTKKTKYAEGHSQRLSLSKSLSTKGRRLSWPDSRFPLGATSSESDFVSDFGTETNDEKMTDKTTLLRNLLRIKQNQIWIVFLQISAVVS